MNILVKIAYCILLLGCFVHFKVVSMEMNSEDFCEAETDEAITQWYTEIFELATKNKDVGLHMARLGEKIQLLEQKLDETRQQMQKIQEQQHQHSCNDDNEIVIQRRLNGSVDFYRTWQDYKQGFGDSSGEFFIGLDKLHKVTNTRPYGLLIVLEDWENQRSFAKYDRFVVGSEKEDYVLKQLGEYSGSAGDSLSYHVGQKFSTRDRENDKNDKENCAVQFRGAWWYNACHHSNLNGLYINGNVGPGQWAQGIHWFSLRGHGYSLKYAEMILIKT